MLTLYKNIAVGKQGLRGCGAKAAKRVEDLSVIPVINLSVAAKLTSQIGRDGVIPLR